DANARLWPFLLPSDMAREIPDYELVTVDGRWVRRARRWLLFGTSVATTARPRGKVLAKFSIRLPPSCTYCGRRIDGTEVWGFDVDRLVECRTCGKARGRMSNDAFLEMCRRVARRRRQEPRQGS